MNILFFQTTLGVSGGEIWVADAAAKLRDKGHHVVIGCPAGSWMERRAEDLDLPFFDFLAEEDFESNLLWQLIDCIQEEQIDLICCSIPGILTEAPLLDLAVREAGRGSILLRLGVSPGSGALSPERIGLDLETVQGIIVVSEDIKTHLCSQFPSLTPDRVHVIYNGVDLAKFGPAKFTSADREESRVRLDIPSDHTVVAAIGRLDPVKNLPMFIQSAANVVDRAPKTTFLVVGQGSEKQALLETAREAGILDHFRFAGFVEDIPHLLNSIDILVHTALSEGIPNVILEAMAMGKPVIATHVGGIPELVQDGKTGSLISSGDVDALTDELGAFLENPQKRRRLGTNARQHIERNFDRRVQLDELEALFASESNRIRAESVWTPATDPVLDDLPALYFQRACAIQKVHA